MSQWYLLNKIVVGTKIVLPGSFYDDAVTSTANILSAGGVLWPASDPTVAAQAKYVQAAHQRRGLTAEEMQQLLVVAAISSSRMQKVTVSVPLATIQAQTSGTAFAIGSVLPANARLIDFEVDVLTAVSGGTLSAVTATLQGGTDSAGSIMAATSVFTGAKAINSPLGSNPYPSRGGQQVYMTLTATGDTLAHATAGSLAVVLFYEILA